ncbi:MAG: T9SS type A sorting domain-containing protein [Brumimicrobium sp.]|nr:T9SS type A sorting domain-containing protein [Brumimicrobium sp.]
MVTSLYISDSTLTEQYLFPCDSTNILVDDTTITDPASTNEFELNDFTAKIFPNPGSEAFTITFSDPKRVNQIIAYSSEGKKITQIPTKGHTLHVNVSSWAKGVYYIKVNGDSFSTTLKYLKR